MKTKVPSSGGDVALQTIFQSALCVGLLGSLGSGCTDSDGEIRALSQSSHPDSPARDQRPVVYFYSKGCPECDDVKESAIPLLLENGIPVEEVCIDTGEGLRRVLEVEGQHDVQIETLAPLMLVDGVVLQGSRSILRFAQGTQPGVGLHD